MKICVVGAGVIGLTTARALLRRGHQVILVDAAARAGQGCSFANGAQLSYSYVAPLADASVWAHLPAYLLEVLQYAKSALDDVVNDVPLVPDADIAERVAADHAI